MRLIVLLAVLATAACNARFDADFEGDAVGSLPPSSPPGLPNGDEIAFTESGVSGAGTIPSTVTTRVAKVPFLSTS